MNRFTLVIALTSVMGFAGCSLFGDGVADVAAAEAILSDRTVQPSNLAGFEAAIHTAASSDVSTECLNALGDGDSCGNDYPKQGGVVLQGKDNIAGDNIGLATSKEIASLVRDTGDDYTSFEYENSDLLEDLHGNDYYYFSDTEDAEVSTLMHGLVDDRSGEVLLQYYPVTVTVTDPDTGLVTDDDFLVAGTWLVQIPDTADGQMEVFSFALAHGDQIDEDLGDLTGTATYGAIGGSAEASGYFFSDDRKLSRFLADAVLEVNFDDDTVSGQITNADEGGYPGPAFTLELEAGDIVDDGNYPRTGELRSLVFKGATAGEMDGALVNEKWAGKWGGKLYGGDGSSAPEVVYGTFGATCSTGCTTETGSILGSFIAPTP